MPDYTSTGATAGGLIGGPIGAGIGALAGGLLGVFTGGGQKRKGRNLINQPYPTYEIPTEITTAAREGLPSEQYAQAMRNIQRQQASAISASQDRRSGVNSIARTQQLSNDALLNLDVANASARQKNQQRLAQYKDKKWDWNVKSKYLRDYAYGMSLLGAGNANTMFGLDKLGAGVGLIAGGGGFNNLFKGGSGAATGGNTYDDSLPVNG